MVKRMTTKELFGASLLELAETTPLQKITIGAIAENCGMTTRTFYNNFLDKFDLINWIYIHQLEEAYRELGTTLTWPGLMIRMISLMDEQAKFYSKAMEDPTGDINFMNTAIERGIELLMDNIVSQDETCAGDDALKFQIYMYFHGISGILGKWMREGRKLTVEQMSAYFMDSMPEQLKPYLQ